jgi:hypothetical protein
MPVWQGEKRKILIKPGTISGVLTPIYCLVRGILLPGCSFCKISDGNHRNLLPGKEITLLQRYFSGKRILCNEIITAYMIIINLEAVIVKKDVDRTTSA